MKKAPHSDPGIARINGLEITYDTFGEASASPLLIMGLGAQMIAWHEEFCSLLATRGYRVIRFDNRDIGLSTKFHEVGVPDPLAMLQKVALGEAIQAPYTLLDMAGDAVGLLDALDIPSAHIVGASMGGMIAQEMVIHYPERVRTLTSIMSTTNDPGLPPPKPEAVALLAAPAPEDRQAYIEHQIGTCQVLAGPKIPYTESYIREQAGREFDRGLNPAGMARQLAAIIASASRRGALRGVKTPTLVIHGDIDPLVPVEGGIDTADSIPQAKLLIIEGMGHALPPAVWPQVVEAIAQHAV
jgi:pimeloyl-ACP methyl ester carboxylesterase